MIAWRSGGASLFWWREGGLLWKVWQGIVAALPFLAQRIARSSLAVFGPAVAGERGGLGSYCEGQEAGHVFLYPAGAAGAGADGWLGFAPVGVKAEWHGYWVAFGQKAPLCCRGAWQAGAVDDRCCQPCPFGCEGTIPGAVFLRRSGLLLMQRAQGLSPKAHKRSKWPEISN